MRIQVASVLACVLMSVVTYAQRVDVDSDPAAPFATYKTYTWTEGTPAPDSIADQRIHAAVDAQLASKGMTQNDETPGVVVAAHVVTHEQQRIVAEGFRLDNWGSGGSLNTSAAETYVQGTLIVDLYDAQTSRMVWRGVAIGTACDKPSKNSSKIDKALARMFAKYPPV